MKITKEFLETKLKFNEQVKQESKDISGENEAGFQRWLGGYSQALKDMLEQLEAKDGK